MQILPETKNKKGTPAFFLPKSALMAVLILGTSLIGNPFIARSANVSDLKIEQEQKQQRLNELKNQINDQQKTINKLVQEQNTLQNQIALFTAQINQATAQIVSTQTRIELANEQIAELSFNIGEKQKLIVTNRERLSEMIRTMYELDQSSSSLIALLNNDNISDFLNDVTQLEELQGQSYEVLQGIKIAKVNLEENKAAVEQRKTDLEYLEDSLRNQKRVLDTQVGAKNELVKVTRGKEQTYRQLLAQTQAEEDKIEKEIQDLDEQIRKQLGQRTSPGKRGLFVWPMDGYLTQRYGKTGFTALGYNYHNGIDVAAPPGTPIAAAFDGKVTATGKGQYAYGNWVAISHSLPNGRSVITLYAHMLRISVTGGQSVKAGQTIGTEGNTGNTTRLLYGERRGFHLHFTVFDAEGFRITPGKYGNYEVPNGYTYDPMDFL